MTPGRVGGPGFGVPSWGIPRNPENHRYPGYMLDLGIFGHLQGISIPNDYPQRGGPLFVGVGICWQWCRVTLAQRPGYPSPNGVFAFLQDSPPNVPEKGAKMTKKRVTRTPRELANSADFHDFSMVALFSGQK